MLKYNMDTNGMTVDGCVSCYSRKEILAPEVGDRVFLSDISDHKSYYGIVREVRERSVLSWIDLSTQMMNFNDPELAHWGIRVKSSHGRV